MKTKTLNIFGTGLLAGALALAGCSKKSETTGHDKDDGHNHGASAKSESAVAQCAKHKAPKGLCFICDPALRDQGRLWCKEHNRYEDRCWECHPDARDKQRLFCDEHGLYEDECFLCHPELKGARSSTLGPRPSTATLMCQEHGVLEAECGICRPELAGQLKPGQSVKVRLPAADSAAMAGVQTGTPTAGGLADGIECFAELAFNQNKLAQITPLVGGIVQSVEVDLGSRVKPGDLLARVTSVAIGEAQSAYVKALAEDRLRDQTLERERNLRAQRISSEKDLQEAETAHQAALAAVRQARQQLLVLGFDGRQIQALAEEPGAPGILEIRAPFAGEIVERTAVQGAMAETGKPLFTLADRATMWAGLNIPEAALSRVRDGQTVELRLDSIPGRTFTGKLTWVGAEVDERSRMARARAEVPNAGGVLRAKMFARARILTRGAEGALVLPASAIQRVEGRPLVFVKLAEDLFEARAVRLGTRFNGRVEVFEGLKPREQIVLAGGFPLKSQLLISRLGAGCADD